jgi:putative flippase GtrA
MSLLQQIVRFGAVGACATLTHIGVAWSLIELSSINQYVANLAGAIFAYLVSFFGNALFTFGVKDRLAHHAARYLFVSIGSLFVTSLELAAVDRLDLPTYFYALIVLLTVPPATFLFAKLWAFAAPAGLTGETRVNAAD